MAPIDITNAATLDLDLLRTFVAVVDAGGFTRAGERVHRTQSTVSQQIRKLEDDLGHRLIDRSGAAPNRSSPDGRARAAGSKSEPHRVDR